MAQPFTIWLLPHFLWNLNTFLVIPLIFAAVGTFDHPSSLLCSTLAKKLRLPRSLQLNLQGGGRAEARSLQMAGCKLVIFAEQGWLVVLDRLVRRRMDGFHVFTYIGNKRRHHSYLIGEGGESKVQQLGFRVLVLKLGFWILRARICCNKSNAMDMLPLMASVSVTENSPTWLHRSRFARTFLGHLSLILMALMVFFYKTFESQTV